MIINSTPSKFLEAPAGGYNGDKDGYEIPAGTDVFVSVCLLLSTSFYLMTETA